MTDDRVFLDVGNVDSFPESVMRCFHTRGTYISVVRVGERIFAFGDDCPHIDVSLAQNGIIVEGELLCYRHYSRFDLNTGSVLEGPAEAPLTLYDVKVVDGRVMLYVDAPVTSS